MLRARRYIIFAVEKILNVSTGRKRSAKIDEKQVEASDWTTNMNTDENHQCFTEKFLQYAKRVKHVWMVEFEGLLSKGEQLEKGKIMKRNNSSNMEYSLFCELIRSRTSKTTVISNGDLVNVGSRTEQMLNMYRKLYTYRSCLVSVFQNLKSMSSNSKFTL